MIAIIYTIFKGLHSVGWMAAHPDREMYIRLFICLCPEAQFVRNEIEGN